MRKLSFKITLPSSLSGSVSVNLQRASLSLRIYQELPSSCVLCLPIWHSLSTHSTESFKNTSDKMILIWSFYSCIIVPISFYSWDCLIPSGEFPYATSPHFPCFPQNWPNCKTVTIEILEQFSIPCLLKDAVAIQYHGRISSVPSLSSGDQIYRSF